MLKKGFLLILIVFTAIAYSQPVASFEKKQIDFGTVTEGTVCKYTFKFRNTGNKPLIIHKVDVTCGCTTPRWKTPIAPGDTSSIYIELNTSFKQGYLAKGVNLTVNADVPEVNLVLLVNVIADTSYKVKIDSTNFNPLKIIYHKSYFQIDIYIDKLNKKGLKGDAENAEKLVKYILRKQNDELLNNIWYSSNSEKVQLNTFSNEYNTAMIDALYKELKSKRRIKKLQKKMKKTKGF